MRGERPRHWREICQDVLREANPTRLNALFAELLASLEELERERRRQLKIVGYNEQEVRDAAD
jgi:hypothetical protein